MLSLEIPHFTCHINAVKLDLLIGEIATISLYLCYISVFFGYSLIYQYCFYSLLAHYFCIVVHIITGDRFIFWRFSKNPAFWNILKKYSDKVEHTHDLFFALRKKSFLFYFTCYLLLTDNFSSSKFILIEFIHPYFGNLNNAEQKNLRKKHNNSLSSTTKFLPNAVSFLL